MKLNVFMRFRTELVLSLALAMGSSFVSCSDELSEGSAQAEKAQPANVELTLEAGYGLTPEEDLASVEDPRSFTLQVGRGGRNRPHILIQENDEIPAHLIFAYTDTDGSGNPIGTPTVIADQPVAVTLKAKQAKVAGQNDNYWGLEALKQPVNISQIETLQNKAWFVMGVVGATWNANAKRLEFDPNSVLFDPAVKLEEGMTRKAGVPHTFAWKRIYFQKAGSMMRTSIDGVRFKPRGLFVRMNLQNVTKRGLYVPQRLQFPAGQGYSPKTSLKLTATLEDLKSTTEKHVGFNDLSSGQPLFYEFPRELIDVTYANVDGTPAVTTKIYDYKYYLGTMVMTNPYIKNPQESTPYFWLWLGDVDASKTSTYTASIHGQSLGTLANTHKFTFRNMAIPADKAGYTVARTGNITKFRPYLPLEFVARGNLSKVGYGKWNPNPVPYVPEVGPNYSYAGGSVSGLTNGGGTFSYREFFDWDGTYMTPKAQYNMSAYNRFIPGVEDWRSAIPNFRFNDEVGNRTYYDDDYNDGDVEGSRYTEANSVDWSIIGYNRGLQLFGSTSESGWSTTPMVFPGTRRTEWMTIRDWNNDGSGVDKSPHLTMEAMYTRVSSQQIVGVRFIDTSAPNDAERRLRFAAYRMTFANYVKDVANPGGLTVECVYIGNERLDATKTVAEDENAWAIKILDPMWWEQKEQESEVIRRFFPIVGIYNAGEKTTEGGSGRYFVNNVWGNNGDSWLGLHISKYGQRVTIGDVGSGNVTGGNNLAMRYFVTEPRRAFEQWGSRN